MAAAVNQVGTGTEQEEQSTRLGSVRMAQLEQNGFEVGRVNRAFIGFVNVAGGVVPVTTYPTTTGPFVLYNAEPAGGKLYHITAAGLAYASGTAGADGAGLFGGVSNGPLATALVANGATNFFTQSTRGYGLCSGYVDVAKTIPAGTAWMFLGGMLDLANTVTGPSYYADVRHIGWTVPPGYAFILGALGDTGSSAKFSFSVAWNALDGDLQ